MPQALVSVAAQWPSLSFGPINLWSFPAAWKFDEPEQCRAPVLASKDKTVPQVNPLIRRILSSR